MNPESLEQIIADLGDCQRCRLSQKRNRIVFGDGDPRADLFVIGEAPGEEEDLDGIPFVGRAGKELNKWLKAIHLSREEIYITNTVKCRPPNNRDPMVGETAACRPFLVRQISAIQPKVILTLGSPAIKTMLPDIGGITKVHGEVHHFEGIPLVPTFHPAAVLRSRNIRLPQVVNDLRVLVQILYGRPS